MTSHHGPSIPNKYPGVSKTRVAHHPRSSTRVSFLDLTLRKESPGARTMGLGPRQRVQDVDNNDGIRIQYRCHPNKTLLCPHPPPGEGMFQQIKSELEPNLFLPWDGTLSPNWNSLTRGPMPRNQHLHHWHPLHLLLPSSKEWTTFNPPDTRTRNIRGQRKPSEDGPTTFKILSIYRHRSEPPRIQNFHICRDGLNPRFFGMSDHSDSIQSCHTIFSIMKSTFGSLITHLSSPVLKEGPRC